MHPKVTGHNVVSLNAAMKPKPNRPTTWAIVANQLGPLRKTAF